MKLFLTVAVLLLLTLAPTSIAQWYQPPLPPVVSIDGDHFYFVSVNEPIPLIGTATGNPAFSWTAIDEFTGIEFDINSLNMLASPGWPDLVLSSSDPGYFVFRLTATENGLEGYDEVQVFVTP